MVEHEISRRVPYGVWIEEAQGSVPSFYLAHGLGPDGLRLRARHAPRPGHPVQLRLLVENERRVVALQGEVAEELASEEGPGFRVRFVDLDDDEQLFLEELMLESDPDEE